MRYTENSRLAGSTLTPLLKYGNGILMIRGSGDKADYLGYGPVDVTIENNNIYDNEHNGIYMGPNNSGITIIDNSIYDNGWDGVIVDLAGQYWNPDFEDPPTSGDYANYAGSENVAVNNNSITGNTDYGVRVVGVPTNGF
ncbi:MAG: right-handed parallel beta-helix repeat-containing protein [Bacteroidota bacterium]|nr:right-handed parallel beta-helix repeat-containing protein [Bacteroidota bacterium]